MLRSSGDLVDVDSGGQSVATEIDDDGEGSGRLGIPVQPISGVMMKPLMMGAPATCVKVVVK